MVIQAQPFGDTEIGVYDTDFLVAPGGPGVGVPSEPPVPAWVSVKLTGAQSNRVPQAIPDPETNS